MKFFDSLIEETKALIASLPQKCLPNGEAWNDLGENQIVLQRDTAFELDGTGFNLITSAKVKDEITVVGPDLSKILKNQTFARISIIEIEDVDDEQKAYNLLKKIEYTKYHFFPEGYMIRTSSRSHKEVVRVSKKAVKSGVNFQKIGSLLIDKYKENPAVKGVNVIFITDPEASFGKINEISSKNTSISEALNHIMNSVNFDCTTCNLKPICDEVEGMKELHFKNASM